MSTARSGHLQMEVMKLRTEIPRIGGSIPPLGTISK